MLDQLMNMAKSQIGGVLADKGVSADKVDEVASISQDAVKEGVMEQVTSGNLDGIMNLFNGKEEASASNPVMNSMISAFTSKATSALGLDSGKASGIAAMVMPMIVNLIQSKMSGGEGGDSSDLLSSLGLDQGNMMDKAKDMLGDKAKDLLGEGGLGKLFS